MSNNNHYKINKANIYAENISNFLYISGQRSSANHFFTSTGTVPVYLLQNIVGSVGYMFDIKVPGFQYYNYDTSDDSYRNLDNCL